MRVSKALPPAQHIPPVRGQIGKFRAAVMAASASVLSLSLLLVGAAGVTAATCTVPGTHATIQAAVNDPTCSVINVAPGAYAENVVVNRTVDIFGSAGTTVVTGSFTVNAADVTIDGFTVTNPGPHTFAIVVKAAGDGAVISNNTIFEVGESLFGAPVVGIYLERGPDNVTVSDNDISVVLSGRSAQGILVGDTVSTDSSEGILIEGNSISHITSGSAGAYGIHVSNAAGTTVEIRDNNLDMLTGGGWAHGIALAGPTPEVVVENNSISNLLDLTPATFNNAIGVVFEDNPYFPNGEVHFNDFYLTAAQYGIAVVPVTAGSVDGTCNWWNSLTGPTHEDNPGGTGAQSTDNVDYQPWLVAPASAGGVCAGGNVPTDKDDCKKGGWMTQSRSDGTLFRNQGDCIQYANTGR